MQVETPSLEPPRWRWSWAGVIVLLAFLSYGYVLLNAQWIWDDPDYIWRNPNLVEEGGLRNIWADNSATPQYYPVVHTSFWLEYQLVDPPLDVVYTDKLPAAFFHFNNVLIFALTALVFWRVLLRLRLRGALLAVLLFAVHPVNVESVAWVTERKNMLSGLFGMLVVLSFLRFARIGDDDDDGLPQAERTEEPLQWKWFAIGFLFWALGLLSKSVIAFIPPALFLILWWKRPKDLFRWEILVPLLVLLIPGAIAGLHTAHLEKTQVGAGNEFFPEYDTAFDRLMLAGTVVWVYLKHLLLPIEQMFFYPKWDPEVGSWWQWILLIAAVGLPLFLLARAKQWGRGPLVAVLIFGGALFPVMGFANVYPMRFSWVADHFQYHANFAMFALLGALLVRLPIPTRAGQAALGVVLAGFVGLSNFHGLAFKNAEELWRRTVAVNPDSFIAHQNLGVEVNRRATDARAAGNEQLARELEQQGMQHFYDALALERDPYLLLSIANSHLAWFHRYRNPADLDQGEPLLDEALAQWKEHGIMHRTRGDYYLARNQIPQAYESYNRALELLRNESFQSEFLDKKLQGPVGAGLTGAWSRVLLDYGKQLLGQGQPAQAFEVWSRPHEPYSGEVDPEDPRKIIELYGWGEPNRWFEVELHRLWMLAAYQDAEIRDGRAALEAIGWVENQAGTRFQQGGVAPEIQDRYRVALLDVRAAAFAAAGQFRDAIEASAQALRLAREQRAPKRYLDALIERNQRYRAKQIYTFEYRVPVI